MSEPKTIFEELFTLNVNENVERKKGGDGKELSYLSWAWAWAAIMKRYPDASYTIYKDEKMRPYVESDLGLMCYTTVTIGGITREMWLPVMDSSNKAMKTTPYEYQTRYGVKTVQAATMYDVNKTIMRCLVKNLAMFGLGLYIYAGEDIPETLDETAEPTQTAQKAASKATKVSEVEVAIKAAQNATSTDELTDIWRVKYVDFQSNQEFKAAVQSRGAELRVMEGA